MIKLLGAIAVLATLALGQVAPPPGWEELEDVPVEITPRARGLEFVRRGGSCYVFVFTYHDEPTYQSHFYAYNTFEAA